MNDGSLSKSQAFEERLTKFSVDVLKYCNSLKLSLIITPILQQLIRSSTSIGANYMEVNNASSKRDFKNKIYICKKEARETKYWFELLKKTNEEDGELLRLSNECQEFILIFQKIISSLNDK